MNADEHLNAVISFPHGGLMIEVPGSRMDDIPGFVWVIAYALNRPYLLVSTQMATELSITLENANVYNGVSYR